MTRAKTFDCVRMKDEAQKALREEYERRRHEFPTYADFIVATSAELPEVKAYWEKVAAARPSTLRR